MIEKITFIIFPFIIRTILIYKLGVEYVGINGLFSSILQVLSLAELGFSSAIVFSMYKPISVGDEKTICALLMFYRKIYQKIGIIILAVGLMILPFLNLFIRGAYPDDINIVLVYVVYLFNTSISYFLFAHKKSLLLAHQRKDIIDKIIITVRVLFSTIQILVLIFTANYYAYLIIMPIITIFENILCASKVKKVYPDLQCKGELTRDKKDEIIEKVKGLLVYKICGVTRNSLDNIFLAAFLGVSTVGMYSNYYYIMTAIRSFMDVITTSMSASIGNSVAVEDVDKNYNDLNRLTFIYAWVCGWCTVCLYCLYQPFMVLWVGESNVFSMSIVAAFCIYFYVWTAGDIRSQYTDACGLWYKERKRSVVETMSNVILNYLLVRLWGVFGIVIATAISIGLIGIPWCTKILFDNYFKCKSIKKYFKYHIFYGIATVVVVCITNIICSKVYVNGIGGFIIKLIICIFIPNICYLILYYKTDIFKSSIEFLKNKLYRK